MHLVCTLLIIIYFITDTDTEKYYFRIISAMNSDLSGPNRAMQPRCAMRFESQTPKSLAMRKSFFFSLAMWQHIRLILNPWKTPEKPSAKILRCWTAMWKIRVLFKIERCEMPAIRTPLRFGLRCERPRCQIASDVGRAMRTTKGGFHLHEI